MASITVPQKAARIRGATWTHDQVHKLFEVWTEPEIYQGLLIEKKKVDIFKKMASLLTSQGVVRKWSEVRAKIKNLKADFRKSIEKKIPFRYYEQMKKIMNLDGSSSRPSSSSSIKRERSLSAATSYEGDETNSPRPRSVQSSSKHSSGVGSDSEGEAEETFLISSDIPSLSPKTKVEVTLDPPELDRGPSPADDSFEETEIISNKRSVIQPIPYHAEPSYSRYQEHSPTSSSTAQSDQRRYQYEYDYSNWKAQDHRLTIPETAPLTPTTTSAYQPSQDYSPGVEHDSSSRSSMVITHVVSNIIEPVTSIVLPSQASARETLRRSSYGSQDLSKSPNDPIYSQAQSIPESSFETAQPPIRLEFVVDNENVILQHTSSLEPIDLSQSDDFGPEVDFQNISHELDQPSSPPPPFIKSVGSRAIPVKKSPVTPKTPSVVPPTVVPSFRGKLRKTRPGPSDEILQQRLKQKPSVPVRKGPRVMKVVGPSHPSRKLLIGRMSTSAPPLEQSKKRKLLEALNKKTVETISSLLTETSHSLLKELQDSEQRFILWEEEKRKEERHREEQMFAKLITAMSASASNPGQQPHSDMNTQKRDKESTNLVTNFKDISKRLNDLVSDEVRATEETIRQWESKMQRQESRHTEKIFAMLINAMKRPNEEI